MSSARKPKHIAIAGNIGAGKTTLAGMLARHYRWTPQFENAEGNPYIVDFYEDMTRWSFHLQIHFLNSRLGQLLEIKRSNTTVIQDRTIYEDAYIFAPNLYQMGLMTKRDYESYSSIFENLKKLVEPPDLLIYLKAGVPKLVDQIQKRGREYEENIRLDYLKRLNNLYNAWIDNYEQREDNLLIVNVDKLDFEERKDDFAQVVSDIDAHMFGLFNRME
jgi:deoxyadenosine/deoxycytidine kinase